MSRRARLKMGEGDMDHFFGMLNRPQSYIRPVDGFAGYGMISKAAVFSFSPLIFYLVSFPERSASSCAVPEFRRRGFFNVMVYHGHLSNDFGIDTLVLQLSALQRIRLTSLLVAQRQAPPTITRVRLTTSGTLQIVSWACAYPGRLSGSTKSSSLLPPFKRALRSMPRRYERLSMPLKDSREASLHSTRSSYLRQMFIYSNMIAITMANYSVPQPRQNESLFLVCGHLVICSSSFAQPCACKAFPKVCEL